MRYRVKQQLRVLHAGGPGDVVAAHQDWERGIETVSEVSRTVSGQVADCCEAIGARLWCISRNSRPAIIRQGAFVFENRPRWGEKNGGVLWHASQFVYAMRLLLSAIQFRANVVVVDSGTTHWFFLAAFRVFGIKVIPLLHNALWPRGFRPQGWRKSWIKVLDGWFWRRVADATIAVSSTCLEQVKQIAVPSGPCGPLFECRYQFREALFDGIKVPPTDFNPFCILFAGRITRSKGVFDILEIAKLLEQVLTGICRWELCGGGPDLDELRKTSSEARLDAVVRILGRLDRHAMADAYGRSHAVIVPTRGDSEFCEGLPLVIAEAVLSGRPVITSHLTNASDAVGDCIVEVEPHNLQQYAQAIEQLVRDADLYHRKQKATIGLRKQFVDGERGLSIVLREVFQSIGLIPPCPTSLGNNTLERTS